MSLRASGILPADAHGLLALADSNGGLQIRRATWQVAGPDGLVGGVFGPITRPEAETIVGRLRVGDDPGSTAQDAPWAAVALRPGGSLAATASMMLDSGLFHSHLSPPDLESRASHGVWAVATDPQLAARAGGHRPVLDVDFLREFALLGAPLDGSPFTGVDRSPAGETLRWRPGPSAGTAGTTTSVQWCGPDTLAAPGRSGASVLDDYLDAFDHVVAELADRAGPAVVATLSGGLDSTFTLASLVRATGGATQIHAYCHTPIAEALAPAVGMWDPDDWPLAHTVASTYGDDVVLRALRNEGLCHPLDAAAAAARKRGWPVSGVGNIVWLTEFADQANSTGSPLRFFSTRGNATFSDSHRYAAGYYLRSGRPWRALGLVSPGMRGDMPLRAGVRTRLIRPVRAAGPHPGKVAARRARIGMLGPAPVVRPAGSGRDRYLIWLTGRLRSLAAANNPSFGDGNLVADPFASRTMIELAASIEPSEWQRGHADRALARRLGEGRIPDAVRLRRRRGGQGRDTLYVIRTQPRRLLDSLEATPASLWQDLGIDVRALRRTSEHILDPASDPPLGWVEDVLRTAAVGEFAAAMSAGRAGEDS